MIIYYILRTDFYARIEHGFSVFSLTTFNNRICVNGINILHLPSYLCGGTI